MSGTHEAEPSRKAHVKLVITVACTVLFHVFICGLWNPWILFLQENIWRGCFTVSPRMERKAEIRSKAEGEDEIWKHRSTKRHNAGQAHDAGIFTWSRMVSSQQFIFCKTKVGAKSKSSRFYHQQSVFVASLEIYRWKKIQNSDKIGWIVHSSPFKYSVDYF